MLRVISFALLGMGALGALALSSPARADDPNETAPKDNTLYGFFGIDFGYSAIGSVTSAESAKDGTALGVKGIGSKYWHDWVGDIGLGYFHDQTSATTSAATVKVTTNGGFAELGGRYRLTRNLSFGPVVNVLFGPDVGFSEDPNSKTSVSALGGVRVQFDVPMSENVLRLGAHVITDLTISNRQLTWIQADVQFGLPFSHTAKAVEPIPEPMPAPLSEPSPQPEAVVPPPPPPVEPTPFPARVTDNREVDVTLNDAFFHFDTNSTKLKPAAKAKLKRLAFFLLKNQEIWRQMRIEGHTDRRGSPKHNTQLSQLRANSVKKELVNGGLPPKRIHTRGFGPTRPIDPAHTHPAYAKNRRVEVILDGVKDPQTLANEINELSSQ